MKSFFDRFISRKELIPSQSSNLGYIGRDIENLLNHTRLSAFADEDNHLNRCVLNYGLPSLAGNRIDSSMISKIASEIEQALTRFEPRLDSQSIVVRSTQEDMGQPGALMFTVDGILCQSQRELRLRLSLDVHFGAAIVTTELCV